jgi:NAD(P)-dependent dehydrogenase (short-subunit alcohol dehydrogenase family)
VRANDRCTWGAPIEDFTESAWDKVMDLNIKALFFLTRDLLPLLRQKATATDPARVINLGSIDGTIARQQSRAMCYCRAMCSLN